MSPASTPKLPIRALAIRALAPSLLALASGCFVFDESLYQERDASVDSGSVEDAGPPPFPLADDCTSGVPRVELAEGETSWLQPIDTRTLSDDHSNLGCTGRPSPGPDGFFAIQMQAGERWHIHVRRRTAGADPVLYLLRGICDERNCDRSNALDACRAESDEHLSLTASAAGTYYVGIDSSNAEGFAGSVEVFRPACGNGVQEHGESCEPNVDPGLACSDDCRVMLGAGDSEHEVNDDAFMANVLGVTAASGAMSVGGRIGALCEIDVYSVEVPEGAAIRASLRTAGGADCPAGTPSTELELVGTAGVVLGTGTARGASACPSIDETDTFATGLRAGRYHLRVYALNEEVSRPFDYSLRVEIVAP